MKKTLISILGTAIIFFITVSAYATSNLIAVNAIHKLHETYVVFKFDKLPKYKSEIVSGGGTVGKDFVDGKNVKNMNKVNGTSIDLFFYDSVNKTGKTEVKLPKSIAQKLTIKRKLEDLDADIHLGKYLPNFVWSEGNSIIVTINNNSSDYEKKIDRYSKFFIKNVKLGDGKTTWVYIFEINNNNKFILEPTLGKGKKEALATVSEMLWKHHNGIAAVNTCYFGGGGLLYSIYKKNGIISSTGPYHRTALGINDEDVVINSTDFSGAVYQNNKKIFKLESINRIGNEKVVMFTPTFWNKATGTKASFTDISVVDGKIVEINPKGNSLIPGNGFVLSVSKESNSLASLKVGDNLKIVTDLGKQFNDYPTVMEVGPRLVKNGIVHVTSKEEHFLPDIAKGRAPRTGFGFDRKGNYYLVVVDGRREDSVGMTLEEFAGFMLDELNICDAMNFDGGGSSEMVIDHTIVNRPSDGHERKVGASLLILKK